MKDMKESAQGSRDHWEKDMGKEGCCDLKYSSGQFSNPAELKESADQLASYVKKNRMKY